MHWCKTSLVGVGTKTTRMVSFKELAYLTSLHLHNKGLITKKKEK